MHWTDSDSKKTGHFLFVCLHAFSLSLPTKSQGRSIHRLRNNSWWIRL